MWDNKKTSIVFSTLLFLGLIVAVIMFSIIYHKWSLRNTEYHMCLSAECLSLASRIISRMDTKVNACSDFYRNACGSYSRPVTLNSDGARIYTDIVDKIDSELYASMRDMRASQPHVFHFVRTCEDTLRQKSPSAVTEQILAILFGYKVRTGKFVKSLNSTDVFMKLTDLGVPPLLTAELRANYNGIKCVAPATRATEDAEGTTLCVDVIEPVLQIQHTTSASVRPLLRLIDFSVDLDDIHTRLTSAFHSMEESSDPNRSKDIRPYKVYKKGRLRGIFAKILDRILERIGGSNVTEIYVRNIPLLERLDKDVGIGNETIGFMHYALFDAYIRLSVLLGGGIWPSPIAKDSNSTFNIKIRNLLGVTVYDRMLPTTEVSRRCLNLAYLLHRQEFRAIYRERHEELLSGTYNAIRVQVIDHIKAVFRAKMIQAVWMPGYVRTQLETIANATVIGPFESDESAEAIPVPDYSKSFADTLVKSLTSYVAVRERRSWNCMHTLESLLEPFANFRHKFRDGLMTHLLGADYYPDYLHYSQLGYLTAFELAEIMETHPVSAYYQLDQKFALNYDHEISYKTRRRHLLQLYDTICAKVLANYTSAFNSSGGGMFAYKVPSEQAVSSSVAVQIAYEAYVGSESFQLGNLTVNATDLFDGSESRPWRLPNLEKFSDKQKFFYTLVQMWCESMTDRQFKRHYMNSEGVNRPLPGAVASRAMTRTLNHYFSKVFGCSKDLYEIFGIFSQL